MNDLRAHVEELVGMVQDRLGTDESGPETEDLVAIADYWFVRYFEEKGYTYYSMTQSARPEKTKLAERGWFLKWRVPSMIDPNRRAPTPENDPLEHDLVARVARGAYIDQTLVKTPAELIEEAPKEKRQGELGVTDVPTTLQKLHDHLVKIAPVLQT